MSIDIRAIVNSSLGEVVQGSISDSYVQDNGLILTNGACVINDIITPNIGDIVTFTYTKNGQTKNIPRKLRVLSSFADPVRRITQVKLGCKLTYLSDWKEPDELASSDDPDNSGYTAADKLIVTMPVAAKSVLDYCLTQLGITSSSNPLTNKFSIQEFNLSGGYVNIINKLLVSESYCGYLDYNEVLQIFNLDQPGGTGPVLTRTDLIELDALGFGDRPADNVYVSFSSLKLNQPENADNYDQNNSLGYTFEQLTELKNWERSISIGSLTDYDISYPNPNEPDENGEPTLAIQTFSGRTVSETITKYKIIPIIEIDPVTGRVKIRQVEVVNYRETEVKEPVAKAAPAYVAARLIDGIYNGNNTIVSQKTREEFIYDSKGNQIGSTTYFYQPAPILAASCDLPAYIKNVIVVNGQNVVSYDVVEYQSINSLILSAKTEVKNQTNANQTLNYKADYQAWLLTKVGQKTIADAKPYIKTVTEAAVLFAVSDRLVFVGDSTNITESGATQARPSQAERNNAANASITGDPNNGYRTTSTGYVAVISGTIDAKRSLTLNLPYAPDDTFSKQVTPQGVKYYSSSSDAGVKALKYGRVQNRLLLGNRNGMSIQADPDSLPAAPYSPIIIELNGISVLYRLNASSWAFNNGGLIMGTDALFWGAIGGTGTGFWFPVAPGIVTLPSTPPIVDGQMVVEATVPAADEKVILDGVTRLGAKVESYNYAFTYTLTQIEAVFYYYGSGFDWGNSVRVNVPKTIVTVSGGIPTVLSYENVYIDPPTATITIQTLPPAVDVI